MKKYIFIIISTLQISALSAQDCSELLSNCQGDFLNFAYSVIENADCKQWEERCDLEADIYRGGKVSIGTNTFLDDFSLIVTDGIIARSLIVCEDSENWCDYVFDEDYHLLSLREVNCYIEENGHLPKTPSTIVVEAEGGFEIGKVALNHQEKIEEAFLHLIQMKKSANALQEKLRILKIENKQLKEEIEHQG